MTDKPTEGSTAAGQPLMDTEEAAAFLGLSARALEARRHQGKGPPYVRISSRAVRYEPVALRQWIEEKTVRRDRE